MLFRSRHCILRRTLLCRRDSWPRSRHRLARRRACGIYWPAHPLSFLRTITGALVALRLAGRRAPFCCRTTRPATPVALRDTVADTIRSASCCARTIKGTLPLATSRRLSRFQKRTLLGTPCTPMANGFRQRCCVHEYMRNAVKKYVIYIERGVCELL